MTIAPARFRPIFLLLCLCITMPDAVADQRAEALLQQINAAGATVTSAQFDVHYRHKNMAKTDTVDYFGSYMLLPVPEDTIMGRHFRLKYFHNGVYREDIFTGDTLWLFDHSKRSVEILNPHVRNIWMLRMPRHEYMAHPELLQINRQQIEGGRDTIYFRQKLEPAEQEQLLSDDKAYHYLKFEASFKSEDYESQRHFNFKVDSATLQVTRMESTAHWYGQVQYDCVNITNIHTNLPEIAENIRDVRIPAGYAVKYSMDAPAPTPEKKTEPLLAEGELVPEFDGTLPDGTEFRFDVPADKSSMAKLFLFDFWYVNCGPCQMAMPYLQKMHTEFYDAGLHIIGLNHHDVADESKKNMLQVLETKKYDYQQVLIAPAVAKKYRVNSYPTMYLVNSKGEIIHAHSGFWAPSLKRLKEFIGDYLKQH